MLPWQLKQLPEAFVRSTVKNEYTILDNGAAEGATVSWNQLAVLAEKYQVNEVVVPDRLGDCRFSISNAQEARVLGQPLRDRGVKLMAVVQGRTLGEVMKCAYAYAGMDWIDVIALPRVLNATFMPTSRLELAKSFAKDPILCKKPIHCLGAFYPYPQEVLQLAQIPLVRSMDTSMPWVYGIRHKRLQDRFFDRRKLRRPLNYFDYQLTQQQREVCEDNARTILRWAQTSSS